MTTELVFHFQLVEIYAIEGPTILDTASVFFFIFEVNSIYLKFHNACFGLPSQTVSFRNHAAKKIWVLKSKGLKYLR